MKEQQDTLFCALQECQKNEELISIYCYDEDDNTSDDSYTGWVVGLDHDLILLACISSDALYDGFVLKEVSEIYRIDRNTYYEKKMAKLYRLKHSQHPIFKLGAKTDLLKGFLEFSQTHHLIFTITQTDGYSFSGFLKSFDQKTLTIREVDSAGEENGTILIRIGDVLTFELDGYYEQCLRLLQEEL